MHDFKHAMFWLLGGLALASGLFLLRGRFNAEARARRRREKSHRPVISRRRGPAVRLAVEMDKDGRGAKR